MNPPRHNPNLGLPRRNHPRTIRPNQPRLRPFHKIPGLHHIQHRNPLSNTNHERNPSRSSLQNPIRSSRRRHKDHRNIRPRLLHRLFDGIENRPTLMNRPALTRRNATHNLRPILRAGLRMKSPLTPCNSLHNQPSILINQNRHYLPPFAAATAKSAASFIVAPTSNFKPESFKIFRPSSTFVPSRRKIIGSFTSSFLAAATT